jgi:hypothetical protein
MTDPSSHTPDQIDDFVLSIMHEMVKHPQKVGEFQQQIDMHKNIQMYLWLVVAEINNIS